jgi:hypothetical protein
MIEALHRPIRVGCRTFVATVKSSSFDDVSLTLNRAPFGHEHGLA